MNSYYDTRHLFFDDTPLPTRDTVLLDRTSYLSTIEQVRDSLYQIAPVELPSEPRIILMKNAAIFGAVFIGIMLLLTLVFLRSSGNYGQMIKDFFNNVSRSVAYDGQRRNDLIANILIYFLTFAGYSLFVLLIGVLEREGRLLYSAEIPIYLLLVVAATIALFALKWVLLRSFSTILKIDRDVARHFIRDYFIAVCIVGILLLFLSFLTMYVPTEFVSPLIIIGLCLFCSLFVLVMFKCVQLFFSGLISLCYIILYLCAFEILPILVAVKFVFTQLG